MSHVLQRTSVIGVVALLSFLILIFGSASAPDSSVQERSDRLEAGVQAEALALPLLRSECSD